MPVEPKTPNLETNSSFLTDTVVRHGPHTQLGRFFLQAARHAEQKGITLKLCQPDELLFVNRRNHDNWLPLAPCYDPSFNELNETNYIGILGFLPDGRAATANAIRLYDWSDTNLAAEARSLRFMYDVPRVSRRPGECCEVTATAAAEIKGRAAFSGAAWVHPDLRRNGLGHLLPLTVKALAVSRWWPDVIFGVMSQRVHGAGFAQPFGFDHEEFGLLWRNSPLGDLRLAVLWTTCDHVIEEMRRHLERSTPKMKALTGDRHASHSYLSA